MGMLIIIYHQNLTSLACLGLFLGCRHETESEKKTSHRKHVVIIRSTERIT